MLKRISGTVAVNLKKVDAIEMGPDGNAIVFIGERGYLSQVSFEDMVRAVELHSVDTLMTRSASEFAG